ncbi:MAG TPA: VOC family protein [Polyangiales bacterium]|nr:VOC family protein [Polyangiales bacterium]
MPERTVTPGRIVFHELNSHDLGAAQAFYARLFGWRFEPRDEDYLYIKSGELLVGGLFKLPPPEVPAHWLPYIAVEAVDDARARAEAASCTVIVPDMQVPNGRFAILQDPQGAVFQVWQGRDGPRELGPQVPGNFCWDQLNTPDAAASAQVYGRLFGWAHMPFAGVAELSLFLRADEQVASLMQGPSGMRAHWLAYVKVESLAEARERVWGAGGKVLVERIEVPQMGAFSVLQDTEGAPFAAFASG